MSKIALVTGAGGQLATEYEMSQRTSDDWEFVFVSRKDLDITKIEQIEEVLDIEDFSVVINLAAYTDVEAAEQKETEKCFAANATGPRNLAEVCNKKGIPLIHISTDYVFDGEKDAPYVESDLENPINDYGRTKFVGEKWIQENHDWYYILRTSWVYSNHSKNFYTTMLNLAQERTELNVVDDQFGSPTSTKELCRAIDAILSNCKQELSGIYHFSGTGKTSWKDFVEEIFNQAKVSIRVKGISSKNWKSSVNRPQNSYLSSSKFSATFGYTPLHWKLALREIISERKIIPIKVGDIVVSGSTKYVIVSTDWLKRVAKLSPLGDMKIIREMSFDLLTYSA
jgi:dTDP-4-dehydrorhamnose reductase